MRGNDVGKCAIIGSWQPAARRTREAGPMISGVKARYSKGAIVPLEPLDIEEGANLSISIDVEPAREDSSSNTDEKCLNQTLDDLYVEDYFEKSGQ